MTKADMEARMVKIETTLDYMKEILDDNKAQHEEIIKKFDDFLHAAPEKFACKETEIKVKELEENSKKIDIFNAKIIGIAIGAGGILGFVIAKAWERIFGG